MVQADRPEKLTSPLGGIYTQHNKNLNIATTSSFVTILTVDCTAVRESVFIIHNNAAGDLDYQILATAGHLDDIVAPTGTNDDDKGWVVLASDSIATTTEPKIETFSNPYAQVVIQIKHTTATTDVDIWHRGEN